MKYVAKELFFRVMPKRRLPSNRAVILMYHSVGPRTDFFSAVSVETFESQMAYLKSEGYDVLPLNELVRRLQMKESLGGAVSITFDDGYRDNLTAAYPVLEKYAFPATIFVTTDLIGKNDARGYEHLNAEELRRIIAEGLVAVEPHTRTHPHLAEVDEQTAREEAIGSKKVIESLTGKPSTLFAYPYGSYSKATARLIETCGFQAAVTVHEGLISTSSSLFELPRVSIDQSTTPAQFRGKLTPLIDRYESLKRWIRL